ncbi:MAG TPA: hypothetical protein VFS10_09415 [Pyrinomonadaceae bacterium]|nr:hypothetical protein [Pyrinomonadaceae bacterium]
MNFFKKLTGIIVFVAALAGAVVLTKYYGRPEPAPAVEATPPAPPAVPSATDAPAPVVFKPQLITLDFASKKSHTSLLLERDPSRPAPQKVWVWTYFFTAETGRERKYCAGEPVEVRWPSADSLRERVTVEAPATTCAEPRDASTTFYARVNVSAESAFAARLSESKISYELTSATPVVVQGLSRRAGGGASRRAETK